MGRSRVPAIVGITSAVILVGAAGVMYVLNPLHTATRNPIGRVFGFMAYRMPALGMEPTIHEGDNFVASAWPLATRDPQAGEIIVFRYPPRPEITYVKRVVATGGSTIEMHGGVVSVDGKILREPYVAPETIVAPEYRDAFVTPPGMNEFSPRQVPEGHFFVLGDNRGNSEDSRVWGFVPRDHVIGVYNPGD